MTRPSRPLADAPKAAMPQQAEVYLSAEQLATACGLALARLYRLVRLGVIEHSEAGSRLFSAAAAARLRKILRLRADLGVNLAGAEIIIDLVARIARLEEELARVRSSTSDNKEMG